MSSSPRPGSAPGTEAAIPVRRRSFAAPALALLVPALLVPAGCGSTRQGASALASAREAAARSASALPRVSYDLRVTSPAEGAQSAIPWIEVRGRTGAAELFEADLVVALDISESAMLPSGVDLDEDGVLGQLRGAVRDSQVSNQESGSIPVLGSSVEINNAVRRSGNAWRLRKRNWTTDYDDTIAEAQRTAARILIQGLGPRRNRIGVIAYTNRARVRQELGPPEEALETVERLRMTGSQRSTSIAAALRRARLLLSEGDVPGRQRALLLFTDGRPNQPGDEFLGRIQALYAADDLAEAGIDLYVFTFGQLGVEQARFLLELVGSAGRGRLFRVIHPGRLLEDLPSLDLGPRWLEVGNVTSGAEGRVVRTGADGRFDAYVPLVPGDNRIRVLAELGDGRLQRWEQQVRYQPPEGTDDAARRAEERVLRELEARAAEARSPAAPDL